MRMPLHESLVAILRERRLDSALSPASVMSFESDILKRLRRDLDVEMVQLVGQAETVRRAAPAAGRRPTPPPSG